MTFHDTQQHSMSFHDIQWYLMILCNTFDDYFNDISWLSITPLTFHDNWHFTTNGMTFHDITQQTSWLPIMMMNHERGSWWKILINVKSFFWKSFENQFYLLKKQEIWMIFVTWCQRNTSPFMIRILQIKNVTQQ